MEASENTTTTRTDQLQQQQADEKTSEIVKIELISDNKINNNNNINEILSTASTSSSTYNTVEPIKSIPINTLLRPIQLSKSILPKEHRPRSVTASVFSQVTELPPSASLISLQQQTALRTQTVTASVFQPISVLLAPKQISNTKICPKINTAASDLQSNGLLQRTTTADMNKGYLMFLDEGSELTSKYFLYVSTKK